MRKSKSLTCVVVSVLVCSSLACDDDVASPPPFEELGRCTNFDALKQPFFGDTHVHTALSLDANLQATRLVPSEAYAFAKGQSVGIQPFDGSGKPMRHIQLDRPLDFVMLSDHAEFFGTISVCTDPQFAAYGSEGCKEFRDEPSTAFIAINSKTAYDIGYPDLCGTSGFECKKAGEEVWKHVQRAADAAYDKSSACTFTSFVGFEWSSNPRTMNLHRNVLFRNHVVPSRAANALDEKSVEDLWASLESECLDKKFGCDVITIPHNSNLSNGLMFLEEKADGKPFDLDYLRRRQKMEPLFEVFQHKGDSECSLEQTASDEYCGFEKLPWSNLASANLGGANLDRFNDAPRGDFLRAAYGQGLALESRLGVNPFQYGIIASTDTHIAAPGQVSEKYFPLVTAAPVNPMVSPQAPGTASSMV